MSLKYCECGGKAKHRVDGLWFVICTECGEEQGGFCMKGMATKAWNEKYKYVSNKEVNYGK